MNEADIKDIMALVKDGELTIDEAVDKFRHLPFENLSYAMIDHHRALRRGQPETIYCEGKTVEQICGIVSAILERGSINVLASRASREVYEAVKEISPEAVYNEIARMIIINRQVIKPRPGKILVISAGTSDLPVAEEAALTAEVMGNEVVRLNDVGIAGLHRVLSHLDLIKEASVIVTVAGMDGALPGVVGGLSERPVIAVPTSVGYGASFGGLAALLTMLNSCASGITVVNIDNGYGAGFAASQINRLLEVKNG